MIGDDCISIDQGTRKSAMSGLSTLLVALDMALVTQVRRLSLKLQPIVIL
ncbi:uncharacterized protein DS421_13g416870 [Arachis hypogaea]|nr:uncharacterized protein DS421_13g416870 [Arachis hypogaea]